MTLHTHNTSLLAAARRDLRERLEQKLARAAVLEADDGRHTMTPDEMRVATPAAVLVPLVNRDNGLTVLLTQRTAHLNDHAGQVSFPGGRVEEHDPSAEETALRETEEEIGLMRRHVSLLGRLPEYFIPTGFRVIPVVAWVEPPFDLRLDAFEVAEAFEVPLAHFLDATKHVRQSAMRNGRLRHFYALPYEERNIWGATAGMLVTLARILGD